MKTSLQQETRKRLNRHKRGFTILEVMISSALAMVVTSQVVVTVISSQRMLETTLADMELSLQSRAMREKLLYNINEDGGLMNASQSELSLVNGNNNKGDGLNFKSKKGKKNRIVIDGKKKIVADLKRNEKWLDSGSMLFQGTNAFGLYMTNGTIEVTLDMVIPISTRRYQQRNLIKAQIMNE